VTVTVTLSNVEDCAAKGELRLHWSFGDGSPPEVETVTASGVLTRNHVFGDDRAAPYQVLATVTDEGDSGALIGGGEIDIAVLNRAPVLTALELDPNPVVACWPVRMRASVTDVPSDTPTCEWDFDGDGRPDAASACTDWTEWTFAGPGSYDVAIRVTDEDGGEASEVRAVAVDALVVNAGETAAPQCAGAPTPAGGCSCSGSTSSKDSAWVVGITFLALAARRRLTRRRIA